VVQVPPRDWVGREVHLEASVQEEAILLVRPHPPADPVRRLEDDDLGATLG
jgi:hypothetical protein